jgi:hypothetical protein
MSPDHDPRLTQIELALAGLAPSPPRLDRDTLMYEAGRASARRESAGRRGWLTAAAIGLVALGQGALLARRPPERVVERLVVVREPAQSEPVVIPPPPSPIRPGPPDLGPSPRDRLAWAVLRYGLDGLPTPGPSAAGREEGASQQALRREIGKVLELGDPS